MPQYLSGTPTERLLLRRRMDGVYSIARIQEPQYLYIYRSEKKRQTPPRPKRVYWHLTPNMSEQSLRFEQAETRRRYIAEFKHPKSVFDRVLPLHCWTRGMPFFPVRDNNGLTAEDEWIFEQLRGGGGEEEEEEDEEVEREGKDPSPSPVAIKPPVSCSPSNLSIPLSSSPIKRRVVRLRSTSEQANPATNDDDNDEGFHDNDVRFTVRSKARQMAGSQPRNEVKRKTRAQ